MSTIQQEITSQTKDIISAEILQCLQPFWRLFENTQGILKEGYFKAHSLIELQEAHLTTFKIIRGELQQTTCSEQQQENVLYALCALSDETIACSEWPDKTPWQQKTLQMQFFQTQQAGEGFFVRLAQIQNQPADPKQQAILTIYAFCLTLGFKGKYILAGQTELYGLRAQIKESLQAYMLRATEGNEHLNIEKSETSEADTLFPYTPTLKQSLMMCGLFLLTYYGFCWVRLYYKTQSLIFGW